MMQKQTKRWTNILLALDGSEISRNTATTAIQLAKRISTGISGLYVVDEELVLDDYAEYQKELGVETPMLSRTEKAALFEKRGREIFKRLRSWCKDAGIGIKTEVGLGGVGEMVLDQAQKASILAIGRRGNGHPGSLEYLGSNFCHIAHRRKGPLLIGGDSAKPFQRILIAYNGKERAQRALDWVDYLQDRRSSQWIALVVQEEDGPSVKAWKKEITSKFSEDEIKNFRLVVRKGDAAERIAETAVTSGSDLVIMGGYRHRALLEWLEGSTVDSVLRKMPLPILVA
jgi:nucleotide-binding universal stress UspA family protein